MLMMPARAPPLEQEDSNRNGEGGPVTLIARLKVTLSDIEPQGLRRLDLSLKITPNRLHGVIRPPWDG